MSHTLRDQMIAAQAARNEALRRMHQAIECYQEALQRVAELEAEVTQLRALLETSTSTEGFDIDNARRHEADGTMQRYVAG